LVQNLGRRVVLQLVGNLRGEDLDGLKAQIRIAGRDVVLDVGAVVLIGLDGIRFFNACESDGITITNASPYISEWMALEPNSGSSG
jgi:hypothetical protein